MWLFEKARRFDWFLLLVCVCGLAAPFVVPGFDFSNDPRGVVGESVTPAWLNRALYFVGFGIVGLYAAMGLVMRPRDDGDGA